MARTRAEDYEDKRALIFERAAELFADQGFARTSIARLAAHCQASKSWIYHYFPSKEAILYEILREHMDLLLASAERAVRSSDEPRRQLRAVLRALMAAYAHARAKHVLLLNELTCLPVGQQHEIRALERRLVALVADLVKRIASGRLAQPTLATPVTMLLFGMINWTDTWYRESGALRPEQLADLATNLFLDGLNALAVDRRLAG
jgi:TetR/AcrR family transcriptional regulator